MAQGILSVKLNELESRYADIRRRINTCEDLETEQLDGEIESLRRQCVLSELELSDSLEHSHIGAAQTLLHAYESIERAIRRADEKIQDDICTGGNEELSLETQIYLAEYMLDFAALSADRALLAAMEAVRAQRDEPNKEESIKGKVD